MKRPWPPYELNNKTRTRARPTIANERTEGATPANGPERGMRNDEERRRATEGGDHEVHKASPDLSSVARIPAGRKRGASPMDPVPGGCSPSLFLSFLHSPASFSNSYPPPLLFFLFSVRLWVSLLRPLVSPRHFVESFGVSPGLVRSRLCPPVHVPRSRCIAPWPRSWKQAKEKNCGFCCASDALFASA